MSVAIDALDLAGIGPDDPIAYETLLADHLPEIEFEAKRTARSDSCARYRRPTCRP